MEFKILLGLLVTSYFGFSHGGFPEQGFTLIVNQPELKATERLYLYAFHTILLRRSAEVHIQKDGGLESELVETGVITFGNEYGCYLSVWERPRSKRTRSGIYKAELTTNLDNPVFGFVRTKSSILDTRGVFTYTVWPKRSGSTDIAQSPENNIGVRWFPGCRSINWWKGKVRNVNKGPRLMVKTTDDAGIYTLKRRKRGRRGYFVNIQVIAATCDISDYWDGTDCVSRTVTECENGGVLKNAADECLCPPFFNGDDCSSEVSEPTLRTREFTIAATGGIAFFRCGDLKGGDPECRGYLFCYPDLFGCKCASGFWGNNCDKPCRKGKWGIGCSLTCPGSQDCDHIFGPEP